MKTSRKKLWPYINNFIPPWLSHYSSKKYIRGVTREGGGYWGACDPPPPLVSHVLSKQPKTGGKNDMKIW